MLSMLVSERQIMKIHYKKTVRTWQFLLYLTSISLNRKVTNEFKNHINLSEAMHYEISFSMKDTHDAV